MPNNKKKKNPTLECILFVRGVPKSLKAHFKAACALRGIEMNRKIISMMREWIQEIASKGDER